MSSEQGLRFKCCQKRTVVIIEENFNEFYVLKILSVHWLNWPSRLSVNVIVILNWPSPLSVNVIIEILILNLRRFWIILHWHSCVKSTNVNLCATYMWIKLWPIFFKHVDSIRRNSFNLVLNVAINQLIDWALLFYSHDQGMKPPSRSRCRFCRLISAKTKYCSYYSLFWLF